MTVLKPGGLVPTLGKLLYLDETEMVYVVSSLWTKADGTADVHLVEVEQWNARRRLSGLSEVVISEGDADGQG